jgi:S-adenosylmethionine synthetase
MGVERGKKEEQGAGDQGMMFGYAVDETENYLPLSLDIAHELVYQLAEIRREGKQMKYLRPDSKSQVTIEYNDNGTPERVHTIVVSTQHDEFDKDEKKMLETIKKDVINILVPRVKAQYGKEVQQLFDGKIIYHVNPTGKFVIGGPHGDSGLTGRKIILDTYGGRGAHGGGAFSGKDPSKVDRSAAYAARHIAKNMVAAGVAREMLVQVSYAIGVAEPVGIFVNTFGTSKVKQSDGEIAKIIDKMFDLRPAIIEKVFDLRKPIYSETAAYGHMGRQPRTIEKTFKSFNSRPDKKVTVRLFSWEELNKVSAIKKAFGLK